MVTYQKFFEIAHEEATRKGLSGAGSSRRRQNLTSAIGAFWRQNESTVRSWSVREAREWAQDNVSA